MQPSTLARHFHSKQWRVERRGQRGGDPGHPTQKSDPKSEIKKIKVL